MPKVKKKCARKEKLTHDQCRMRICIWCGKKRPPGSVRPISQANLRLVSKHGGANLDPSSDDQLPKAMCTSCRLGLKELETPSANGRHQLPPFFDYRYVSLQMAPY